MNAIRKHRNTEEIAKLREECEQAGISIHTYRSRRNRQGMTHEEALQPRRINSHSLQFTDDQIFAILNSDTTLTALSKEYRCSKSTINAILTGQTYANVHPDIPRRHGGPGVRVSCWYCEHHRSVSIRKNGSTINAVRCGIGLPDPIEEGATFARLCNAFVPTSRVANAEPLCKNTDVPLQSP
jgi:hypothetical protein